MLVELFPVKLSFIIIESFLVRILLFDSELSIIELLKLIFNIFYYVFGYFYDFFVTFLIFLIFFLSVK